MDQAINTLENSDEQRRSPYFQLLDIIRGLAAIAVVVYHATMQHESLKAQVIAAPSSARFGDWVIYIASCGYLGVPIFFMISGYCITASAISSKNKGQSLGHFLIRRIKRIYPPYWIWLIFCLALEPIAHTRPNSDPLTVTQWFGNIFLFEGYRPWFLPPDTKNYIMGSAWTLCYEEQFYIFMGLLLLCPIKRIYPILLFVVIFVIMNNYNLNIGPLKYIGDMNAWKFNLDGLLLDRFWLFFSAGIWLCWYRSCTSKIRYLLPMLLMLAILWELRQWDWYTNRYQTSVVTFGLTLLLCIAEKYDNGLCKKQMMKPLKWLGARTYSIYLVHLPLVFCIIRLNEWLNATSIQWTLLFTIPVSLVLSVVVGQQFHHWVEKPWIPQSRNSVPDKLNLIKV